MDALAFQDRQGYRGIAPALLLRGLGFGLLFVSVLERNELVRVLESYCPPFPGFYVYYPSRKNMAPKLRGLVQHIQRCKHQPQ